jgi:hypothetical protein
MRDGQYRVQCEGAFGIDTLHISLFTVLKELVALGPFLKGAMERRIPLCHVPGGLIASCI